MKRLALLVLFAATPAMLFYAGEVSAASSSSSPTIKSLNPSRGDAGTSVNIVGSNLGNKTAFDFGLGYVRFGGFINTSVGSWNSSDVQITVPAAQDALSNYSEYGLIWTVGNIASLDVLNTATFGLRSLGAVSTTLQLLHNTTVAVTVVPSPFVQSNESTFTYLAQPSSQFTGNLASAVIQDAYDTYLADTVEAVTNPVGTVVNAFQQTIRSAIEIPTAAYNLLTTGQNPAQPITSQTENISSGSGAGSARTQGATISTANSNETQLQETTPQSSSASSTHAELDSSTAAAVVLQDLKQETLQGNPWLTKQLGCDANDNCSAGDFISNVAVVVPILQQDGLVSSSASVPAGDVQFTSAADPYLVRNASGIITQMIQWMPASVAVSGITSCADANNSWIFPDAEIPANCYAIAYTASYTPTPFMHALNEDTYAQYNAEEGAGSPSSGTKLVYQDNGCWEVSPSTPSEPDETFIKICSGN